MKHTVFALDLAFSSWRFTAPIAGTLFTVSQFLRAPGGIHVLFALLMIAVFSGFYTVPLMTFIQQRSAATERSRVIAGNNILNALLIVTSSVVLVAMVAAGLAFPTVFLVLALLNLVVTACVFTAMPEFWRLFAAWLKRTVRIKN